MTNKHTPYPPDSQLLYQAAVDLGLKVTIESTRFKLISLLIGDRRVYIKGSHVPLNLQSACAIANNKFLSKKIFRKADVRTPKSSLQSSIADARQYILQRNLFPCVIKPLAGAHGNDVYANIQTPEELEGILQEFSQRSDCEMLIEEYIPGVDYRILVVGGRVSAALERTPAHVIGDGQQSIQELIDVFNMQPMVGEQYEMPMCKIIVNFELMRMLRKARLSLRSVLKVGQMVFLKQNANISSGGISTDVTDTIGKKCTDHALKATRAIGIDYCGVDVIYNPVTKKAYVLEVNARPGIDIHHFPVVGESQDAAGDVIRLLISKHQPQYIDESALLPLFDPTQKGPISDPKQVLFS